MIEIREVEPGDAAAFLEIRTRTRAFLAPWEPAREPGYFTRAVQERLVRSAREERAAGRLLPFTILEDGAVAGGVNLDQLARGVFENAYLGYWVDAARGDRGVATEAVRLAVAYGFGEARLHRIQAAVMPRNAASLRVLAKVGFREEGLALRYLRIAGVWEDHRIFALTAEERREAAR